MEDDVLTLEVRVDQALSKACEDNSTDDPTLEQIFNAGLALAELAPDDERWYALTAVLL